MDTIRRTSTLRRTAPRRTVSDREAMKQLVEAVEMSARKKVLESGRKPRILTSFSLRSTDLSAAAVETKVNTRLNSAGTSTTNGGTVRKELRFFPTPTRIPVSDYNSSFYTDPSIVPKSRLAPLDLEPYARPITRVGHYHDGQAGYYSASDAEEGTESEGPPSPSPTPRPGSAMSRRSGTPTLTGGILSGRVRSGSASSTGGLLAPWSASGFSSSGVLATSSLHGRRRSNSGSGFPSIISVSESADARNASTIRVGLSFERSGTRTSHRERERAPSGLKRMSTSFVSVSIADDSDRDTYTSGSESESDGGGETTEMDVEGDQTQLFVEGDEGKDLGWERSGEQEDEIYDHEPPKTEEEESSRSLTAHTSMASEKLLEDLTKRHRRMMLDIGELEQRLEQVSRNVRLQFR
jgi:hypothetical protein